MILICLSRSNKKKKVTFAGFKDDDEDIDYSCLKHVEDICESLAACSEEDQPDRLTFILDDKRNLWATIEPGDCDSHVEIAKNYISLEHLISKTPGSSKQSKGLKPLQCLSLAVNLASSLLQLHTTPWLPENWCSKSIYFPVDVEQPYVSINLGDTSTESSPRMQDDYLNPYIVALGIILLELSQGKSFLEWIKGRDDIHLRVDNIKDKADAALKWLEEDAKFRNVGEAYPRVVQLCLECSFTPVQPKSQRTLTNEKFREAVNRDVVQRLEKIYYTVTNPLKLKSQVP